MTTNANTVTADSIITSSAWADACWPVTEIQPMYAPAEVAWASERWVAIRTRGRITRVTWDHMREAVDQRDDLGRIYSRLLSDADERRHTGRIGDLMRRGMRVAVRSTGIHFGCRGQILRLRRDRGQILPAEDGDLVLEGMVRPAGCRASAERDAIEQAVARGLCAAREVA